MAVPERRLRVLVRSWRSISSQYERGYGLGEDLPESERRALASAWRMAASMLEEDAGLCVACAGRGREHVEAFEDEPASWVDCSYCGGSGRSHLVQCACCARLEAPELTVVYHGDVWCGFCARADQTLRAAAESEGGPVSGLEGVHVWEPPFGEKG